MVRTEERERGGALGVGWLGKETERCGAVRCGI